MANTTARALPFMVGRYECTQYLGGGMCDVYRASDTQYGRAVVIKMLKHGAPADMRNRFEREARVSMKIQHENAMVTYDFAEHEGQLYLVLEFLEGESLRVWLQQPHTTEEKIWVALQVARALEHVHSLDIVYRDLKPENIHVGAGTKVKLMDFGIARSADFGITEAGMAVGTAPYMAPEQIRGENLTPAADIYAFGILLYEIFTGTRPFEGGSYEAIFGQVLFSPPNLEPLQEKNVPKQLVDVIRTCLEKTAPQRFPSMKPIVTVLQSSISDKFFTTMVLGTEARQRPFPMKLVVILVLLLGVGAAAAGYFLSRPVQKKKPPAPELRLATGDMVLVPGGLAALTQNNSRIDVPAFYIDKTEVSNLVYAQFCKQTGRTAPDGLPDDPAVNVTFDDATNFAKWAGKRLPSEFEWEKAARGVTGLRFPWGDNPDAKRANVDDNPDAPQPHGLMPVNSFPEGKSPYGPLNMCGNAWEWTSTPLPPLPEIREGWKHDHPDLNPPLADNDTWYALKGGSFLTRLANGVEGHPDVPMYEDSPWVARAKSSDIGFRCAKDVP
jgi:hypothetical protein